MRPNLADRDLRLRIYLVEGDPVMRERLAQWLLDQKGARLVGVESIEDKAVQWLQNHASAWDLAVVDLFLEQGSGLAVAQCCQNRNFKQKLVVLTDYATPDIRERSLLLGADAVFDRRNELQQFIDYALNEVEHHQMNTIF
jgi:two-component system OmpR family response regulator